MKLYKNTNNTEPISSILHSKILYNNYLFMSKHTDNNNI